MNPKWKIKQIYTGAGIYQFTCNITGMKYVGKSKKCKQRYYKHVAPSNKCGSKSIIAGGDYTYDILERLPLNVTDELLADREQHWMHQVPSAFLVNIRKAKFIGHKAYQAEHKDELAAKKDAYRAEHKDKIAAKKAEKFNCDCGGKYTYNHKSKHIKSKKHIDYIERNI